MMVNQKFYITTTIPYANAAPHIGFALEIVQADVLARWHKLLGDEVFFLTGTDEHGTKIFQTAKKAGVDTQEFVDGISEKFRELAGKLNICNNYFIRTTDEKKHWPGVVHLWKKLVDNGDIYKKKYAGDYCSGCERFITQHELIDGKCPNHPSLEIQFLSEENYFFKLSKYSDEIIKRIKSDELLITPEKWKNDFLSLVKDGLTDVSFSRSKEHLPWGVPVPGDEDQVMYVWCDALTNYLTGVGYNIGDYSKLWPADVHVVGKDMLRFHTGIWPGMLLSAGLPLPKKVIVHGFLTVNGQKMSKSLGNVISPLELIDKYTADSLRHTLMRATPFGDDGDFSEADLIRRNNEELGNELGNLVSRLAALLIKKCNGVIPAAASKELFSEDELDHLKKDMKTYEFHKVIDRLFELIRKINKHLNDTEPWKLQDGVEVETILYTCADALRLVCIPLAAFIPEACGKILNCFGIDENGFDNFHWNLLEVGKAVVKPESLFPKIEISEKNVFPLHLKVGKIIHINPHPNADKLYVMQVELDKPIQLVAGIREHYSPQDLVGQKIIVVTNLKHAKLRGELSEGMLLAAEDDTGVKLLTCDAHPGSNVDVGDYKINTAQISFEQFLEVGLRVEKGRVLYDITPLKSGGKLVTVDISDKAKIR